MMKRTILVITGLLLSTNIVIATETHSENPNTKERYHYAHPIMFVESGVEFYKASSFFVIN